MLDKPRRLRHHRNMIAAIHDMGTAGDGEALDELWGLLGGDASQHGWTRHAPREKAAAAAQVVQDACFGRGEIYAAERKALVELAKPFKVEPAGYPTSDALEAAIVDAIVERVRERLEGMSDEERAQFAEDMFKRMSDEERMQMIDALLRSFNDLSPERQDELVTELARELGLDEGIIRDAIAGGAAVLLPLLLARGSGFTIYLLSTKLMYSFFSLWGVSLSFATYQAKNVALKSLMGPVGLIVTTALSAGWFAVGAWRRMTRFRKVVQVAMFTTGWRRRRAQLEG